MPPELLPGTGPATRRHALALIAGGAAAAVAAMVPRWKASAGHDGTNVMHLGEENVSAAGTWPTTFISRGTLVVGGQGLAHGFESGGDVLGVWGQSNSGNGVFGASWDGGGVVGAGGSIPKDPELRPPGPGVLGTAPAAAPGVLAISSGNYLGPGQPVTGDGGLALEVVGTARFSTAGGDVVPQGDNTKFVANTAVTSASHISVTLAGDPGNRQLRWVERNPSAGFTMHFDGGPSRQRPELPFSYLIVEPAAP